MAGRLTAPPRPPRRAEDIWGEGPTPANGEQPPRIPGTFITPDMSLAEMSVLGLLSNSPQAGQPSSGTRQMPPKPQPMPGYQFEYEPTLVPDMLNPGQYMWTHPQQYRIPGEGAPRYSPMEEEAARLWRTQQEQSMQPMVDIPGLGAIPLNQGSNLRALGDFMAPPPQPYPTAPPTTPEGMDLSGVSFSARPGGYDQNYTYQAPPRISPFQQASLEEETRASKASETLQAERQRGYRQVTPQELAAYYNMLQQLRTFYRS